MGKEFPLSVHAAIVAALDWINRFGGHSPIVFGGEAELAAQLDEARRQLEASFPLSIVAPEIPYDGDDAPLHTVARPFCADVTCPCHYDEELVEQALVGPYFDGLLTAPESNRLYNGQQLV